MKTVDPELEFAAAACGVSVRELMPEGKAAFKEAYGQTLDPDEANWRPLTANAQRDLPIITQERMLRIAHWLWEQNPLANRIIELPVAYLLAEGVKLSVNDEDNQKVLDRFWKDPINEMDIKLPKKVRELSMFGEQLWPAFWNELDGMVRIGYIDPVIIGTVVKDPDNTEQPIGIVTKRDAEGRYYKYRVIINGPESVFTQRTQTIRQSFTDGEAFYFRVNDLSSGSRGRSDLLHQADWLDAYDQFLFGELERYKHLRAFVWDLQLKNADEGTVKKRARDFVVPASGGAYVHNDSETLEPKTPDLKAQDTSEGARLIRNHVLSGASLPEHWFGGGGNVNRATAAEMGDPTFKNLAMRQKIWKSILESVGRYVLYKNASIDGVQNAIDWSKPEWTVQAIFPELVSADIAANAQALQQVVAACVIALDRSLITEELALSLIGTVAGRLGVEIDPTAELNKAKEAAAARQSNDVFSTPTGGNQGGAGDPNAPLHEAVDAIRDWQAGVEAQIEEIAKRAKATDGSPAAIVDSLRSVFAESARNTDRLVEGLVTAAAKRQAIEITLKHGKTKKTITTPGGGQFELTEQDAD